MYELMRSQEGLIEPHFEQGLQRYLRSKGKSLEGWSKLLAWQMGTGKTPSSLTLCKKIREAIKENPRVEQTILVITPAAVRTQWLNESQRWAGIYMALHGDNVRPVQELLKSSCPSATKAVLQQMGCAIALDTMTRSRREEVLALVDRVSPQYLIMNYELAVIHQQWIQERQWLGLIVDEAHAMKNSGALRSRAVMSVDAGFVLLLTGTPVDNRPPDLYNLLKRLDPGPSYMRKSGAKVRPGIKCPITRVRRLLVQAEKAQWTYSHGYRDRDRLVREAQELAYKLFGGYVDVHRMRQAPKLCEDCRYWGGDNPYTGKCPLGGSKKGKPPVQIRYRRPSPYWGTKGDFDYTYAVWKRGRGDQRQFVRAKNESMLNRKLYSDGWATRLLRGDVMSIDAPTYQYIELNLAQEQQKLYNQVSAGVLARIDSAGQLSPTQIKSHLAIMGYLERCSAATPFDFYKRMERSVPDWMQGVLRQTSKVGCKQEWVSSFLDGINGDKAVVFTRWRSVSDPLYESLDAEGYKPLIIRGGMRRQDRDRNQYLFNNSPDHRVIICTSAGFEGINLQATNSVGPDSLIHGIFMDVGWRPKEITQPMARIMRVGLRAKPWFWFLVATGTIDEYKCARLQEKQVYIDRILEGRETGAIDLFTINSRAQLLEML